MHGIMLTTCVLLLAIPCIRVGPLPCSSTSILISHVSKLGFKKLGSLLVLQKKLQALASLKPKPPTSKILNSLDPEPKILNPKP